MGTPSDWVSGERVFAPPTGTFDVEWLVPAVVEAVPGNSPAEARAALLRAWQALGQGQPQERTQEPAVEAVPAVPAVTAVPAGATDPLSEAAGRVVAEALRVFRA